MRRLPLLISCCLLSGYLLSAAPLWAAEVLLSGADDSSTLRAFSRVLGELRPQDQVHFVPLAQLPAPGTLPRDTRLILFGSQALNWRLAEPQGPPTLILRVSRVQAQQLLGDARPNHLSLLWSDPAPARQLRLARLIFPAAKRIGVLHDQHSDFMFDELRLAATALGLEVIDQLWTDTRDTRPVLALLNRSDLLLGLNDQDFYTPQTSKSLLLTSYAQQRALLGPSASFVKAGSLASSYSDRADWLATLDTLLDQTPSSWPRTLYPIYFKVLGNHPVARALGIELADDAELTRQLAEGENIP
ncbi:ABC transporter substrate-binding protein [Pseudomonas cavernicola]|uniref:ABC transporter substrate-binding protein n=1 Tax=Pseudomonas cavernicola TaxID=2320866 RepID=A0A418XB45_9PSED|nr:ABC transporter substrate-binding protein [Pseudomonas cavernicola]RJG09657.1 ABC transporter substrate-binding protein [Pseudomonas cavernicola]